MNSLRTWMKGCLVSGSHSGQPAHRGYLEGVAVATLKSFWGSRASLAKLAPVYKLCKLEYRPLEVALTGLIGSKPMKFGKSVTMKWTVGMVSVE